MGEKKIRKKRVLLIVAYNGYQQTEYFETKTVLKKGGFEIVTASNRIGTATASDGSTTPVDVAINRIIPIEYGGIFFIGGPGAMDQLDNKTSYAVIQDAARENMPLGAICVSPRILAKAGILNGRRATGWNNDGKLAKTYEQHNVILDQKPVVVDGNIITAMGPKNATEFGQAILTVLKIS